MDALAEVIMCQHLWLYVRLFPNKTCFNPLTLVFVVSLLRATGLSENLAVGHRVITLSNQFRVGVGSFNHPDLLRLALDTSPSSRQ